MHPASRLFTWIFAILILWGTTLPGVVVSGIYQGLVEAVKEFLRQTLCLTEPLLEDDTGFSFDVLGHFLLFFLLSLSALTGYANRRIVGLAIVLLATGTELIQSWIPDRTTSVVDLMLDMSGLSLAVLLCLCRRVAGQLPTRDGPLSCGRKP